MFFNKIDEKNSLNENDKNSENENDKEKEFKTDENYEKEMMDNKIKEEKIINGVNFTENINEKKIENDIGEKNDIKNEFLIEKENIINEVNFTEEEINNFYHLKYNNKNIKR
jgi:hypothetical protein